MVEMDQEQSFHVLAGQRNEANHVYNTSVPVAVIPVVISDAGDIVQHRQMSLQANDAKGQPSVKRKRGRPRKIRPEEGGGRGRDQQGQSAPSAPPDDQSTSTNRSRSQAKKKEQVGTTDSAAKSSTDNQGAVEQPGGGVPGKRRGRPRKATTTQTDGDSSAPAKPGSSQPTTVGGTSDYASTAICSTDRDAGVVSGTPVQVLPTAVVADITTINNSPLRRPTTVSIVVPSSAEEVSKLATRTPPPPSLSSSSAITTEDQTPVRVKSFTSRLQGMTTPPLLHAEQPRALNQLPQCVVTNSVLNVSLVDRWEKNGSTFGEATKKHAPKEKQPTGGEEYEEKGGVRTSSAKNEVDSEPVRRRKREPMKKPEVHPLEQAPAKRKRGRPSKTKDSPHTISDEFPSSTRETPRKERVSSGDQPESEAKPEQQSIESTTQATETVVKRKRGRPPKNKSQDSATESPPVSSRQPNEPVADPTSVISSEEGDKENIIAKRGRTAKSCTKTSEATGQLPVKRKRGRPRRYPIPVVAASGPFLPSVSGITLPNDESEDTPTVGATPSQTSEQEANIESASVKLGKNKRGGPPKKPEDEEGPPVKRRPGRPRKNPFPDEKEESSPPKSPQKQASPKRPLKQASLKQPQKQEEELEQQVHRKPGRPRKRPLKSSPEVVQKKIKSPVMETEQKTVSDPLPKRKRGRPKKIQPTASTLQDPGTLSADESSVSANVAGNSEDNSSGVEKLTLQISFSDSDSEHSEKLEVQTSTIMALADRVAPTPSPPRQVDSPLLDPSFEESYDEDSDPEAK